MVRATVRLELERELRVRTIDQHPGTHPEEAAGAGFLDVRAVSLHELGLLTVGSAFE